MKIIAPVLDDREEHLLCVLVVAVLAEGRNEIDLHAYVFLFLVIYIVDYQESVLG